MIIGVTVCLRDLGGGVGMGRVWGIMRLGLHRAERVPGDVTSRSEAAVTAADGKRVEVRELLRVFLTDSF